MEAVWFLLGIVIGAALAWIVLQRLSDRRVAEAEERVAAELAHAREQAREADLAHAETKERLFALQARLREAEAQLERERAELLACRERLAQLESRAAAVAEARARLEQVEAELARRQPGAPAAGPTRPTPAGAPAELGPAAAAEPGEAAPSPARPIDPAEELRRLEAKLAMLPAGSSARALLLKQRRELVARIEHSPAAFVPPPPPAPVEPAHPPAPAAVTPPPSPVLPVEPPAPSTDGPRAAPDDLKLIKGIGPVLERRLHELGVRSFADLAALTPERIAEIDQAIDFPGRIERERWIEQAKELLARRRNG
jgi:predicted flap endonuclease-1-like 5' DNA nuclease